MKTFAPKRWSCLNGVCDSSGFMDSGVRGELFRYFPSVEPPSESEESPNHGVDDPLRFWFLCCDDEPMICLETTGRGYFGGDLNPILGFCFPLFSRLLPWKFPSGWKTTESSGDKIVVNCSQSTYKIFSCVFESILFELKMARFLKHSGSRLNRKEIAKFRIHASAKVLDERYSVSARQARSG